MKHRYMSKDGLIIERLGFWQTEAGASKVLAEIKLEAGSEVMDAVVLEDVGSYSIRVIYVKPATGSAREAVEAFCALGAYPNWEKHNTLKKLALDRLFSEAAVGTIDSAKFGWLVKKLMKAEYDRGGYERSGAGL